jgi:hypothetical protein
MFAYCGAMRLGKVATRDWAETLGVGGRLGVVNLGPEGAFGKGTFAFATRSVISSKRTFSKPRRKATMR